MTKTETDSAVAVLMDIWEEKHAAIKNGTKDEFTLRIAEELKEIVAWSNECLEPVQRNILFSVHAICNEISYVQGITRDSDTPEFRRGMFRLVYRQPVDELD